MQADPILQIQYKKFNEKIPGCLVSILGLLTSLWADCITTVICTQDDRYSYINDNMYISKTIIHTCQTTHFIVVITCTLGLILGLKERNQSLLLPWVLVKILELNALFVGCVFLVINGNQAYIGVMPLGIIFFLIGAYIIACVGLTYKKMRESSRFSAGNIYINTPEESMLASGPTRR